MNLAVLAENLLGLVEYGVGNLDRARDRFTRSVDGFRALAQPWGIANATSGLAGVALAAGDFDEGERLLDELTPVLQHAGPWFVLRALYVRALLAVRRGNPDQAIALTKESLACIQTLHDNFVVVYTLVPLAAAAVLKGDDEWAARILGVRDAVTDRTGATVVDKSVLDLREQSERQVRTRLGPERWARAYAAGRLMSIDQLMENVGGPAIESRRR
jgi:hypothetical protein